MAQPINAFSEDQAGQTLDDVLTASRRVNEAMRTAWGDDHDGLGTRLDALLAADEAASQFIVALKPLLPDADTLSSGDCQHIYPILERLLDGKLEADVSASWGLIIQASCASNRNLVPEDEDTTLCQQIDLHLEQKQSMTSFIETLDDVPAEFASLVERLRRPALAPTAIPCQILGMVMAMSEKIRRKARLSLTTTKKASDPGFEEFVNQERDPDREHGWTLMDLVGDELRHVLGTWSLYGSREDAQQEVDRLNGLNEVEREAVGLHGTAVLAYYSD